MVQSVSNTFRRRSICVLCLNNNFVYAQLSEFGDKIQTMFNHVFQNILEAGSKVFLSKVFLWLAAIVSKMRVIRVTYIYLY